MLFCETELLVPDATCMGDVFSVVARRKGDIHDVRLLGTSTVGTHIGTPNLRRTLYGQIRPEVLDVLSGDVIDAGNDVGHFRLTRRWPDTRVLLSWHYGSLAGGRWLCYVNFRKYSRLNILTT